MSARSALFAGLLWLSATAVAHAQAPSEPAPAATTNPADAPKVSAKLVPDVVELGQLAKLNIEVDAKLGTEVTLPEQPFGGLELSDRQSRKTVRGDRTLTTYQLSLLALEPGKVELPALTLRFVSASGELTSGHTEPQTLMVRSLIANEPNAEPKPATKPVSVMHDDYTLAWVALGLLAIALIATATLLAQRWLKQRPKPPEPAPPPRPAWDLAIERLHALLAQKDALFADDRGEEFVDGVSDALREYLGRRYGFDGLERTTAELMSTLGQLRPHKLSLSEVSSLLEECDLVKFARAKPDANQCQQLWNGALGLIRATTPMTQPHVVRPSQPPPPGADAQLGSLPAPAPTGWSNPPSRPPPARASFPPPPRDPAPVGDAAGTRDGAPARDAASTRALVPSRAPAPAPTRASLPPWAPGALEPTPDDDQEPAAEAPVDTNAVARAFASVQELWPSDDKRDSELPDEPTVVAKSSLRESLLPNERTPQVPTDPRLTEAPRLTQESPARSGRPPVAGERPSRAPAEPRITVPRPSRLPAWNDGEGARPAGPPASAISTPRPPRPRSSIPPPPTRASFPPAPPPMPPASPSTVPPPRSTRPPAPRTSRPPKKPEEP